MQRDLSSPDVWEESLRRSRQRRERAVAQRPRVELPVRGVSLAAAIALTGGTAVALASGGGGDSGPAKAAVAKAGEAPPAVELRPAARTEAAPPAAQAAKPAAPPKALNAGAPEAPKAVAVAASKPAGGVEDLQRALGVTVDGDFGSGTKRALKHWQREHGLDADGVAGPETRRALGLGRGPVLKSVARAPRRRVRAAAAGAGGGGVLALQRALGVSADGVFGPGTERALKSWQRRHGLAADGVAGPQTRRALGLGPGRVLERKRGGGGGSAGQRSGVIQRVVAAANAIATKPYEYGGGHGSFIDSGYDCSGSVSYALHGGGLLSSPLDSSGLMSWGQPGPGRHITVYAHSGHAFMVVDGRRFDTSARWETGSRWTSTTRSTAGYVARHPAGL